jgi:hypothetical protein
VSILRVGALIPEEDSYCGGAWSYYPTGDVRIEAIGADWVVARDEAGEVLFREGVPEDLLQYVKGES